MASRRLDIGSLLCDDNKPPFSPLEVLVHAATQERKRLGAPDDPPRHISPPDPRQSPVVENNISPSPRSSPLLSRYHLDDSQRIHLSQQPLYLHTTRPHPDSPSIPQYPSQDFDLSLEADRHRRLKHEQRIQELEYHRQQESERYRAQELDRQHREEKHLRAMEYQRESERRETERRLLAEEKQREEFERHRESESKRQSERQLELEQHRAVPEKQHSQQFVTERPPDDECRPFLQSHSEIRSPVASISRLISNSDAPQIRQSTTVISPDFSSTQISPSQLDPRPIKKRRYSASPTRDQGRADRMPGGELGHSRADPLVAGPSSHRRPGSQNQPRVVVTVPELLSVKEPQPHPALSQQKTHSPTSRRSPPGSQIGRAKAARKSDEQAVSLRDHFPLTTKEQAHSPVLPESTEDSKVKQEPKSNRLRYFVDENIRRTSITDESRQKKPPPAPKIHLLDSKVKQRDDPHEFFLHQYDQVPTPAKSTKATQPDTGDISPLTTNSIPLTPSGISQQKLPTASTVTSVDKELEDLILSPSSRPATSTTSTIKVKKQEESDDMDLVMTELVENVENDTEKHIRMDVDVEDELLSLVDDRLPPSSNSVRRLSATSLLSAPHSHVSEQLTSVERPPQPQLKNRTINDNPIPTSHGVSTVSQPPGSVARSSSARAASERESMPPPATTTSRATGKKATDHIGIAPTGVKKKKEPMAKSSNAKSKTAGGATTAKPKTKTSTKSKKPAAESNITTTGRSTPPSTHRAGKGGKKSASESRSASVVPSGPVVGEVETPNVAKEEEEEGEGDNEDDKLYCICKTKYDESRFMIACDKCDEWYHTICVNMPDLDVDLVDQFFCPSCIANHPHANLRSTYKQRCLWGVSHPNPDSPKACHKAARGAFSKYCSDECGVQYMQTRVDIWTKKGGKTDKLWESVKNAERREGVLVCAVDSAKMDTESNADCQPIKPKIVRPVKTKIERETDRLNDLLSLIVKMREDLQRGMEVIICRERLLQLASERAEQIGQCGWDQRLCCDDEELADIGAGMLESYESPKVDVKYENGDTDMEVDGHDEQWWCPGKKVCDRHSGWQAMRYKDVCKEKEMKEEALTKLTTREHELRKRIQDVHDPQTSNTKKTNTSTTHLKSSEFINGHAKPKATPAERKGKKRKVPTS